MHYYNFFKNFFNNSILVERVQKTMFLDLKYKKKDLSFYNKKLKKKE